MRTDRTLSGLCFLVALLLLTGCGASLPSMSGATEPTVRLGTLRTPSGTGFSLYFDVSIDTTEVVRATVTGPENWNGGEPLHLDSYGHLTQGRHWRWRTFGPSSLTAITGNYRVDLEAGESIYTNIVTLDASSTLPLQAAPVILEATTQTVSVYWQPTEGAGSYYVRLYHATDSGPETLRSLYTRASATEFADMELDAGETYYVSVHAFTADLTPRFPAEVSAPFNATFASTPFTPSVYLDQ